MSENAVKPWYEMGWGLRRRSAPLYRMLRHVPTELGVKAYMDWVDHVRLRNMQQTLDAFDRIVATLDKDSVVLDIGANLGEYTERLAKTGAHVHSFEPEPFLFSELEKRFADVPNVTLHNAAIAAKAGTVELWLETGRDKDPRTHQSHSIVPGGAFTAEGKTVSVTCIDFFDFIGGLDRKPALIKMDIEGAEVEILERLIAENQVDKIAPLFVETHERQFPELGRRIVNIFKHVMSRKDSKVNLLWP